VFYAFLALVMRYELQTRLKAKSKTVEWADVLRDLEQVQQLWVGHGFHGVSRRDQIGGAEARPFARVVFMAFRDAIK
jgi:hypothetical protein